MNDSKEFAHAIELAGSAIRRRRVAQSDDRYSAFCDALIEHLERITGMAFYVACFSQVEDSLSQWRGYCPTGFGYSIGFDGERLREIVTPQGFSLQQCIYSRREQDEAVDHWVASTLANLTSSCPSTEEPRSFSEKMAGVFLSEFVKFAPYMKDKAFSDEREWRLVALIPSTDPRVQLRPGKSMLVPYAPINLQLSKDSTLIWNILIGPTPNIDLAMSSATHLFQKVRPTNGIGRSMVPYRDW
ncbi:DUF2971 domain-containing protein [Thiobacillus sp.]|uniref:DUF2971 domain-containing protein n=1 Tax=Thiobacillus sp. TaxID=924 RepID=UPI0025F0043D|nr:DUF2971 domain-containing protein [Thiobacillus sp.]